MAKGKDVICPMCEMAPAVCGAKDEEVLLVHRALAFYHRYVEPGHEKKSLERLLDIFDEYIQEW